MGQSQALRLGPFTGGMNTASDPTAVADSELVDIKNFELDIDASLVSRPPIVETTNNSGVWDTRVIMIGRAVLAGVEYVIGSTNAGTYAFDGTTWTTIKAGLKARVALQFQDFVFIVATTDSAQQGGYWDGATFTTDTDMPRGEAAVFHKARMFVAPGLSGTGAAAHQLKYTDPISISSPVPFTWPASGVVSVGQGDGEFLIDVCIYNDNLMLFKQDSTYVLAYDTQPVDAILRKINSNIGATSRFCVGMYENSIFVFHEGNVFEIVNYDFQRINFKVPFLFDGAAPDTRDVEVFLSVMADRLVIRYFNRIYVYGLKTRTWTRWESQSSNLHNFGPLVEFPSHDVLQTPRKFYAGSSILSHEKVYYIQDGYDATTTEHTITGGTTEFDIECSVQTKNYDLADSHHYKKLYWWGIDIVSVRTVVGVVNPVTTETSVSWDDLSTKTWGDVAGATWGAPLVAVSFSVETEVLDASNVGRKFIKMLKALRWRQINYQVTLLNDGTTVQGPCRLFSLTVLVSSKQTIVKQIN